MRFSGKIYKDGRFWLAEIPILDAMTQGHTRKETLEMAADMVETMANKEGFRVEVALVSGNEFEVGSTDHNSLISLLLRCKRELNNPCVRAKQRFQAQHGIYLPRS